MCRVKSEPPAIMPGSIRFTCYHQMHRSLLVVGAAAVAYAATLNAPVDHCAAIAGQKWVSPAQARACMAMAPLTPEIRANVRLAIPLIVDALRYFPDH